MRAVTDWADLMYLPEQAVAHVVPFGQPFSLCGAEPLGLGGWWGTGCMDEYETAADLPVCSDCTHRVPSETDATLPF